ncbi:hypothetical protein NDU88_006935 [Pleurodeles waltl]|uniref:Uncharacterized protein n=1 Tax=Pleurodeles waltl TaxID=8319 RepID=A0AAV7SR37_PLEWA|nr:hypothetical protein NDU88_006935 [Pleurodeles waltl]
MEKKVQQALALLREAGRLDLLAQKALAPGRPVHRASAGVAAAVAACSPPRAAHGKKVGAVRGRGLREAGPGAGRAGRGRVVGGGTRGEAPRASLEACVGRRARGSFGEARHSPAVRRYGARPGATPRIGENVGKEQPGYFGDRRVGTGSMWSSEEDVGVRSGESEAESAGEGPSTVLRAGAPERVIGPLGGSRPKEEEDGSESEEEGVLGECLGERQVLEGVGAPGTPDLFEHGPLDFEEEDPGEQGAALAPWDEEKASPRAASRMTSTERRGRRRRAADASARLCGGVGNAPPDAAAWEEQRLGPVRKWRYEGESAGCAHCKGSGVKGLKKGLDEEDRMSEVTLEEGELRTSGSESEWWERQGRGVANPVRKSLQVSQVNRQSEASQERWGEQRKVQERPPLLSPGLLYLLQRQYCSEPPGLFLW